MADAADIATERIELLLEDRLAARVRYQGQSLIHCEDCDQEIPEGRRLAVPGVRRCVHCQTIAERR